MADLQNGDNSTSCFLTDNFEGLNQQFSDVQEISAQGYTILYRAKRYGRWYALKTLTEDAVRQSAYVQVLRKELEVLMLMQHPSVVQTIGLEDVNGIGPCIVMEYIDGETLDSILKREELPSLTVRRRMVDELCAAVAYVHSLGIVHRDLKPENIMVTRNGQRLKLIDFGMADTDQHAILKQPAGTIQYMAPEQAQTALPDIRNDIYSLGIILSQLQLGRSYKKIVERCLKPIEQRYQSVEELQADLRRKEGKRPFVQRLAVLLLILVLLSIVIIQTLRLQKTTDLAQTQAELDSMRHMMDIQKQQSREDLQLMEQQMNTTMGLLSDSLRHMASDNEQLHNQLHRVEDAKKKALKALHSQMKATALDCHLDTLSRWSYRWPNLSNRVISVNRFIYEYTDNLPDSFSVQERDQIRESLLNEWQSWSRKISNRVQSVRQKMEEPLPDSFVIRYRLPKNDL